MAAGMSGSAIDQQSTLEKENEYLRNSRDFYKRRCEALQAVQDKMRDQERKAVCDILANGSTTALEGANDKLSGAAAGK